MPDTSPGPSGDDRQGDKQLRDDKTEKIPAGEAAPAAPARPEGRASGPSPDEGGDSPSAGAGERSESGAPKTPAGRVQLGEYIIEERIGAGGMGQVYKARQPSLDRMVALKVLPRSVAANEEAVQRFYREARNAARLIHANIVQIYTVGEERGVPYFAMEYVIGKDLEHRLREGEKFSTKEIMGIVGSTAMALVCAEEHGIVHRDIKPGNIMIDTHGVVKIMDFGLAKAVKFFDTEITQAGFIVGTPTYMAPEQAEALEVDHRTDIYSLGVVLYEILTGRPPFQSDDPATLIYLHVHRDPEPPRNLRPEVPEEMERISLKCLAKKPEDRYQSATDLLADLLQAQGSLADSQEEGTIVYDMRMASLLVESSATRKRPPKLAEAAVEVKEAVEVAAIAEQPKAAPLLSAYWPVVAVVAAAAVVLVAVMLALVLGGEDGGDVGRDVPVDAQGVAAAAGLIDFPLSRLKTVLPSGSSVVFSAGGGPPVTFKRDDLADQRVMLGTVKVIASRPFYREVEKTFVVGSTGNELEPLIDPPFSEELFELEPSPEFAVLIGRVERQIAAEDFVAAKKALAEVRKADEESAIYKSLDEKLLTAQERRNDYFRSTLEEVKGLRAKGEYDKAEFLLEQLVAELPAAHELYDVAEKSLKRVQELKGSIRVGRVQIAELLREGRLEEARAALDRLVKDLGIPRERLEKLPRLLETAERLAREAEEALAKPEYVVARKRLKDLTEITTESREYLDKLDEVSAIIERTRQAGQVIANVREQIEEEDFEGAKSSLRRLREVDPRNRELADLEINVRQGDAEYQIRSLLGRLASGLVSGAPDTVVSVIDSESKRFAESARESVASLAASGVRVTRSEYKLTRCDLGKPAAAGKSGLEGEASGEKRAAALVTWTFELDIPSARRRMKGVQDIEIFLRKRPDRSGKEGWRITAVEPVSKAQASLVGASDGAGVGKRGRIQGRITAVDRSVLTIDRGSAHGVRLKMIFTIYKDARVVRLPLVSRGKDDSEAIAVVEEEPIGGARVIQVREKDCLASFLGQARTTPGPRGDKPLVGMLAVRSPLSSVAASVPEILALVADRSSAPMGTGVRLSVDSRNVDALPCYYRFEASSGIVTPERTSLPKAVWYPPAVEGEYTVKVTLVSGLGVRSREAKLRGTGAAGAASAGRKFTPREPLDIGAPFEAVKDIAFDVWSSGGGGAAYILDEKRKNLLVLSSEFEPVSAGSRYRGKPLRIACMGGSVYVLDAGTRSVRRFLLGKDPFASQPVTSYGGPGVGNGKLKNPVAFALAPGGEVAVLDAGTMTVQVFASDGRFLQSVGKVEDSPGGLQEPVGIVADSRGAFYVLDAGRRRVLVFREGRYAGEFPAGTADSEVADIAYDSVGDRLLVLHNSKDRTRPAVTAYSTGGRRFARPVVPAPPGGKAQKSRGARVGELYEPRRIVCDGASRAYVIGGERSDVIDRFDLPRGDGRGRPSGRMSSAREPRFTGMACAPDGRLGLLDTAGGQVWEIVRGGWCVRSVGGRKRATPWSEARDIACDGRGNFYVLDPALATVHRLGRKGERARFGKKGDPSKPENLMKPLAIAATPAGAEGGGGRLPAQVAVLLPQRRFGIHVFTSDGRPKIHFPSEAAKLQSSMSIAIGARGAVHAGSSRLIESFGPDGLPLRRTKLEIDPDALAASPDGTLYALDTKRRTVVCVDPATGRVVAKLQLPREVRSPVAVAVDGFARLCILDGRAGKVYVWSSHVE